jgi:hypothetical protein
MTSTRSTDDQGGCPAPLLLPLFRMKDDHPGPTNGLVSLLRVQY